MWILTRSDTNQAVQIVGFLMTRLIYLQGQFYVLAQTVLFTGKIWLHKECED